MFKKLMVIFVIFTFCLTVYGCGDTLTLYEQGRAYTFDTHGLFNAGEKNPDIQYRIIVGNVIWSIILCETIIAPIYFIGFSLYEPVGIKYKNGPKGVVHETM